jgi:catechol-2,3-dioxygenase
VTPATVVDHDNSYSVYVADPHGNRVEITTYDHDAVERAMKC